MNTRADDGIIVDERAKRIYVPQALEAEFRAAVSRPCRRADAVFAPIIATGYAVVIVPPLVPKPRWWKRFWRWIWRR